MPRSRSKRGSENEAGRALYFGESVASETDHALGESEKTNDSAGGPSAKHARAIAKRAAAQTAAI